MSWKMIDINKHDIENNLLINAVKTGVFKV